MFGLGVSEVLIILVAALIFIGPKKLPVLAKTLGSAFREFQNATKGLTSSLHEPVERRPVEESNDLPTEDEVSKNFDDPKDK